MTVNWLNPYERRDGVWVRGNLHAHAAPLSPCAEVAVNDLLAAYRCCGQGFLSVSEHMNVAVPSGNGLVVLPGLEWNSSNRYLACDSLTYQHHIGVYSPDRGVLETAVTCRTPESLCEEVASDQALLVANHPNWQMPEHFDQYTLHRLASKLDGLEIYNAMMEWDEGEADATGRWDRLLTTGLPLLGFAGDDSHTETQVGLAWMTARVAGGGPEAVFAALKDGNFYCSSGVEITDIGRQGDEIFVSVSQESRIRIFGSGGRLLDEKVGREASWRFEGLDARYARFQVTDRNWGQAWSQPFFRVSPRPY